ncbi:MAG: hypothetical protein QNJ73_04335 [Gammaproteobacteria bacterium]|nr:hypothetical protein [Gammaproteobacteria bacterium]
MSLPDDILVRIAADFGRDSVNGVVKLLAGYHGPEPQRVCRCILHLSAGSIDKLKHNVAEAAKDYRDIILFAEYDRDDNRLHDFTHGFD